MRDNEARDSDVHLGSEAFFHMLGHDIQRAWHASEHGVHALLRVSDAPRRSPHQDAQALTH